MCVRMVWIVSGKESHRALSFRIIHAIFLMFIIQKLQEDVDEEGERRLTFDVACLPGVWMEPKCQIILRVSPRH